MKHIFVVDDEKHIRELIKKYLEKENFRVSLFENGESITTHIDKLKPDLIVLDIMMPGMDGLDLCKEIRKANDIPIVFVSAKDEELDRILGLELGADDYLSKPFSPRELVARIKNIFRRLEKVKVSDEEITTIKDIVMYHKRRVVKKGNEEIVLTTKEFELLEFLVNNKSIPFTREHLIESIWGYDYSGDGRIIDDLIKRLRRKMNNANSQLNIRTVWGFGYKVEG